MARRPGFDNLCERNLKRCLNEGKALFKDKYGGDPEIAVSAPGRVNLIGEHTDYNDGFVFPMALPLMTVIVGRKCSAAVSECSVLSSAEGLKGDMCQVFPVPPHPGAGSDVVNIEGPLWVRYVKGVVALLNTEGDVPPFEAVVTSCVPIGGGVSSSAALEVAVGLFVEELLGRKLPPMDLALVCQEAEQRYAGNNCGIMDQCVSVMAKEGCALLIDCELPLKQDCTQAVPFSDPRWAVVVTDSGVRHELADDGEYNKRRATCKAAVGKLKVKSLRYATMDMLEQAKGDLRDLSDVEYRRARHVISEIARTEEAVKVLNSSNCEESFGKLMNESHESLKVDYEVSCKELNELVSLARGVEGVFGSRMTGGGFGGCTVTFIRQGSAVEDYKNKIRAEYSKAGKVKFYDVQASPGAKTLDINDY